MFPLIPSNANESGVTLAEVGSQACRRDWWGLELLVWRVGASWHGQHTIGSIGKYQKLMKIGEKTDENRISVLQDEILHD